MTVEVAAVDAEYNIPIKTENDEALESVVSNISPDMSLGEILLTKIVPAHGKVNE